jgi:His/Glu/Gln/Arg/opine family amino acid ABC transporter permease subunit
MENRPEKNLQNPSVIVNYEEPARKAAPVTLVGPIGWIWKNLLGSPLDILLTVLSAVVIVYGTSTIVTWSVQKADWLVVNQNFRLFMAGTYPAEMLWRLNGVYGLFALVIGLSVAAYSSMGRRTFIGLGLLCATLFLVPLLVMVMLPTPRTYLAVGEVDIASGTVTERPVEQVGFLAQGGTPLVIRIANSITSDDRAAAGIAGFSDRASDAYLNAAINQQRAETRIAELERRIAADDSGALTPLTRSQRISLEAELETLKAGDYTPLYTRYALNSQAAFVRILAPTSGEVILEGEITAETPLRGTLPVTGWYVIEKTLPEADTLTLLEVRGIYPLISREFSRVLYDERGEPLIDATTGRTEETTIQEFVNVASNLNTFDPRPELAGEEVALLRLTDTKYRGQQPVTDYFTLALAPLFRLIDWHILAFCALLVIGYGAGVGIKQVAPKVPGGGILRVVVLGAWSLFIYLMFFVTIGFDGLNALALGNLLSYVAWIGALFFLGASYFTFPRGVSRGLGALLFTLWLAQLIYVRTMLDRPNLIPIEWLLGDFTLMLARPSSGLLTELVLWGGTGLAALQVGLQSEVMLGASSRRRGFYVSAALWLLCFIVTPFIIGGLNGARTLTDYQAANLLPVARLSLWGGLLLTFILTAVGLVCSFPIGVLLALGRRTSWTRYPVIKGLCIAFIELIRGVPLISVLFMASLLVPLTNPALASVPQLVRAMVGVTIFSAAYLAENVRGGLQSIPSGQEEAGKALGLNDLQITGQIMLPQALRAVIPPLVGQAIALFKDTSLVIIIGLADIVGVGNRAVAQSEFVGLRLEAYVFIALIYFFGSFIMAAVSRQIEESGSGAARRH